MSKKSRFIFKPKITRKKYSGEWSYWYDRKTKTARYRKYKKGILTKIKKQLKQRKQTIIETPKQIVFKQEPTGKTPIQKKMTEYPIETRPQKIGMGYKQQPKKTRIKKKKHKPISSYFKKRQHKKYLTNINEMQSDEKGVYKKLLYKTLKNPSQLDLIIDQIEKNKHYLEYNLTINGTINGIQQEIARFKIINKTITELKQELQESGLNIGNTIDSGNITAYSSHNHVKMLHSSIREKNAEITEMKIDIQFIRGTI